MHPSTLTDGFTASQSSAEARIYEKATAELPDYYQVYHDLRWDVPTLKDSYPRGQTDFVIVHPERGYVCVEVKGGECSYDSLIRAWRSVDRDHVTHTITDPFDQASGAARVIEKLLKQKKALASISLPRGHAAAFPDCRFEDKHDLGARVRECQILDWEGLFDFRKHIDFLFEQSFSQSIDRKLGAALGSGIADLWREGQLIGRTPVYWDIHGVQGQLIKLTEQQVHHLRSWREQRQLKIFGCAGSGKSTLAVHKAKCLAADGLSVLLICYNIPLGEHLALQCEEYPSITAGPLLELCMNWLEGAGVNCKREDSEDFYARRLPATVIDNFDRIGKSFDAVIVDESQDFKADQWALIDLLRRDQQRGVFYVFADGNQIVYPGGGNIPINGSPMWLDRNVRNTNQVFDAMRATCELAFEVEPSGVEGPTPVLLEYDRPEDMIRQVIRLIDELSSHGIPLSDIVLLTAKSTNAGAVMRSVLEDNKALGRFRLSVSPGGLDVLRFESVRRFKGLEAKVIILCEVAHGVEYLPEKLYIGMTRATWQLIVLAERSFSEELRAIWKRAGVPARDSLVH